MKGIKDNSDSFDIAPHNCDIIHRPSIGDCDIDPNLKLKQHLAACDETNKMAKDILTYLSNFINQNFLDCKKEKQTTETPIWVDKNQLSYIILQVVKHITKNNSLDIPAAFQQMTGILLKKPMFDLYKRPPEVSQLPSIHNSNNQKSNLANNTPDKNNEIKKREKQYDKALVKSYKVRWSPKTLDKKHLRFMFKKIICDRCRKLI